MHRARGGVGIDAMVGAWVTLHGALRAGCDRLAEGGELQHHGTPAGLKWGEVDGIIARAVERGLGRRGEASARRIGLDEMSF